MGGGGEHYTHIYIYMCYHTHIYLYICIWIVGHTLMFLESKSTMVPTSKNPLSNPQGKCFSRVAGKLGGVAELDSHFERDVLPTKPTSVAAVSCCQSLRWIFGTTSEFASPPSHTHTHTGQISPRSEAAEDPAGGLPERLWELVANRKQPKLNERSVACFSVV